MDFAARLGPSQQVRRRHRLEEPMYREGLNHVQERVVALLRERLQGAVKVLRPTDEETLRIVERQLPEVALLIPGRIVLMLRTRAPGAIIPNS